MIAAKEVAHGAFYNDFRANEELLAAVSEELNSELLRLIATAVGSYDDPALRIVTGIRMYLHIARDYPLCARFICSAWLDAACRNSLIYKYLPVHLEQGKASGYFGDVDM